MPDTPDDARRLVGTAKHPSAHDLSPFLMHLTRTEADLASILVDGRIEARSAHGLAGQTPAHASTHQSVCLTETPAAELERFAYKRQWGLVFSREFIAALGGQRVWYVNYGSDTFSALVHEMNRLRPLSENHRFFELTPFIDVWREGVYDFDWEREWRVVGDVRFDWSDVEYLVQPDGSLLTVTGTPAIGRTHFDRDGQDYVWTGGSLPELDHRVGRLADEFHEHFAPPGEELWPDPDHPDAWMWGPYEEWDTGSALDELFPERPRAVIEALEGHLDWQSRSWVKRGPVL